MIVYIVFENDMILKVFSSKKKAGKYMKKNSKFYGKRNIPTERLWMQSHGVE